MKILFDIVTQDFCFALFKILGVENIFILETKKRKIIIIKNGLSRTGYASKNFQSKRFFFFFLILIIVLAMELGKE